MPESNDHNLINFIASTVEALRVRIDTISEQMATKVDVANLRDEMATKVDVANLRDEMATKVDLANLRDEMATKEELAALRDEMATKGDLARVESNLVRVESQMATKDGLARLETTMHGEFEQVHIRIDSIDRVMGSRIGLIETDVSRMRSVLYLLVKDKPDMLRLLGQPTPGEGRPQG
jgi:hypothetical protein